MIELTDVERVVRVGIAEGAVIKKPYRIRTTGLGSCVGVVLFDYTAGIAGLVHVMLPNAPKDANNYAKYADVGVPWLFQSIVREGAAASRVQAKLAGGAQMFASAGKSDILRVGPRNLEAVELALSTLGIVVCARDVGGNVGRTIEFDVETGMLHIRTAMRGAYAI